MFSRLFSDGRLDADALIDATGNVPPESMHNAFRVIKPTGDVSAYVMLWQNLRSDEQMAAYQAMGQWTKDHVPFPGATFRQLVQMMRDNAMVNDTVLLGAKPVHLTDIRCRSSRCWPSATTYAPWPRWARPWTWSVRRTSKRSGCRPATSA